MPASESQRDAIEVAARPLRELLRQEHDEIAAAQRALRQAEKAHDRAIELAERQARAADTGEPLAAYGHHVALYSDRVTTQEGDHELTPEVSARVDPRPGDRRFHRHDVTLTVEAPTWRSEVVVPHRDAHKARRLAEEIELAARNADVTRDAHADRRAVAEAQALIHKLGDLVFEGEDVIDMAPGINAGHDGVLVATDQRLLFIGMRTTASFPYKEISSIALRGKWFGARLALSTPTGKGVVSGLAPRHAAEIADLVRSRIGDAPASQDATSVLGGSGRGG